MIENLKVLANKRDVPPQSNTMPMSPTGVNRSPRLSVSAEVFLAERLEKERRREQEEMLDEAIRSVRPGYKPIR